MQFRYSVQRAVFDKLQTLRGGTAPGNSGAACGRAFRLTRKGREDHVAVVESLTSSPPTSGTFSQPEGFGPAGGRFLKEDRMSRFGLLVVAAICLTMPALASAQVRGPWELELGASGENGNKFNGFTGNLNVGVGYFFTDNFEVGVRQALTYNDVNVPASLDGSTVIAVDFHVPLGDQNQFVPFFGANIGYVYGDNVRDTWEGAPEGGIKWFVGPDAFIFAQVQYQFFFRSGSGFNGGFDNGQFVYGAGIGFRF